MLTGSIGMLPSASLGAMRAATRGLTSRSMARPRTSPARASPIPWPICQLAMLLRYSFDMAAGGAIEEAVERGWPRRAAPGYRRALAGRSLHTEMGDALLAELAAN